MQFKYIQRALENLTKRKVTQEEIGEALGIGKSTVNIRMKKYGDSNLKSNEIKKIEKHFKINYLDLSSLNLDGSIKSTDDFMDVPIRGEVEASMGYGCTVYDEAQTATYSISRQLARDLGISLINSEMIFARGNSMQPTVEGGDSLLIDLSKREIYDGKIYCIRMDGQLYAKRLQKISPLKLKVISDNKDYEAVILDFTNSVDYDFEVIGEVRWSGRVFK